MKEENKPRSTSCWLVAVLMDPSDITTSMSFLRLHESLSSGIIPLSLTHLKNLNFYIQQHLHTAHL